MAETGNADRILVRKSFGKRPLGKYRIRETYIATYNRVWGCVIGYTMAQAVSHRPLTAEARVPAHVSDLWSTNWHRDRFFFEFFRFPMQYHSTVALHTHISSVGWTIGPLVIAVQRQSHLTDISNKKDVWWMDGRGSNRDQWVTEISSAEDTLMVFYNLATYATFNIYLAFLTL
jgi:hypothetical protein